MTSANYDLGACCLCRDHGHSLLLLCIGCDCFCVTIGGMRTWTLRGPQTPKHLLSGPSWGNVALPPYTISSTRTYFMSLCYVSPFPSFPWVTPTFLQLLAQNFLQEALLCLYPSSIYVPMLVDWKLHKDRGGVCLHLMGLGQLSLMYHLPRRLNIVNQTNHQSSKSTLVLLPWQVFLHMWFKKYVRSYDFKWLEGGKILKTIWLILWMSGLCIKRCWT